MAEGLKAKLDLLQKKIEGEVYYDKASLVLYATDASVYREMPLAVIRPKTEQDVVTIVAFANENKLPIIPRAAGTSLAGQVVGRGIVVDISKYFTNLIEVNKEEKWARVQPGLIRDDLNKLLKEYGLFFSPETSTANRAMIGGMVGNNSCGAHSVIYGTTRDHVLEMRTVLSDGSIAHFGPLGEMEFKEKCAQQNFEGSLYRSAREMLGNPENADEIRREFPKPEINRRNTGYAIDVLLESVPFTPESKPFNFCELLSGSEGTLAFTTEIKIDLTDLPPEEVAVLAIHSETIYASLKANQIALKYKPDASELMDKIILDCTKENKEQSKNRFFIKGDPAAVLCVEFTASTREEIIDKVEKLSKEVEEAGYGYHFPIIWDEDTKKVWDLRKAGLGLLANIPGDPKAVACIEDTAVTTDDLPEFINDFTEIMKGYGKESVYYAHAGDGEIHLRPVLDLKKTVDRDLFYKITNDVADLVKKYNGSMSGEHGDGRVRGEFIHKMVGDKNYALLKEVKKSWDPNGIFNPGKIVDTPRMNEFLRYEKDQPEIEIDTKMDFSDTFGILRMAEKCNGTGVCRRTHLSGGTMCPSYMATLDEKDTTRGRANVLREFLTRSEKPNRFDHEEIKEVMDLCLGCKGCHSDCPSNVDVGAMKSEFLYQYQKTHGVPFKSKMVGYVAKANKTFSSVPWLYNLGNTLPGVKNLVKQVMGISQKRELPLLYKITLRKWYKKNEDKLKPKNPVKKVYFFADEIINYNDVTIGIAAIRLLSALGYEVVIPEHEESGRPAMSKGMLDYAQKLAYRNVNLLKDKVSPDNPMIGLEPSAILSFRDEYPRLVNEELRDQARKLGESCLLFEEFLADEIDKGNIDKEKFKKEERRIHIHGHCHQKALSSVAPTQKVLQLPTGYKATIIPSGCCGMSGSFGYDKDHYKISMDIGELVLFPAIRKSNKNDIICAPGTSCRHQIRDGVSRQALHPAEILYAALKEQYR